VKTLLSRGKLRFGTRISKDGQESFLQLGRDLDFSQLGCGADGTSVRVDERDARATSLDVPFQELSRRLR
jgi:hypothetical protein